MRRMARQPRLTVPGYPHHIIQRGNNRQPIFIDKADDEHLLELLQVHSKQFGVAIHAYVLMGNHFHLLATPTTDKGVPQMMQAVGRAYVRWFNVRHGRTGTMWEGRYRSTLIQAERYLLACMVYIELNPVRAGMLQDPAEYPWSSLGHYLGRRNDKLVTPHPIFWELGNTPFAREMAYAELIHADLSPQQQSALTEATLRGWALGEPDYVAALQQRTERRLSPGRAGRPRKVDLSPIKSTS